MHMLLGNLGSWHSVRCSFDMKHPTKQSCSASLPSRSMCPSTQQKLLRNGPRNVNLVSNFPQILISSTTDEMCQTMSNQWMPRLTMHRTRSIHSQCLTSRHHVTSLKVLCPRLDGSEPSQTHGGFSMAWTWSHWCLIISESGEYVGQVEALRLLSLCSGHIWGSLVKRGAFSCSR